MSNNIEEQYPRPRLGISHCLLGENVRYDGGHKLNRFLRDTLGSFVEFVPVCPEVECGMTIPRESMHLEGTPENPRLVTTRSKEDKTDMMLKWGKKRIRELESENLCGFIFKSKSPSSGMRDIKIFSEKGMPVSKGAGIFAKMFMEAFPLMPVEDDGRLNDNGLRENFIERLFVYQRWLNFVKNRPKHKDLVDFHSQHKLLLMAHSPKAMRELGAIVANHENLTLARMLQTYFEQLMPALKLIATTKKNTNVLQHAMGYFKKVLSADEKQELLEVFNRYHDGLLPLVVPVTLLNHYVRKYDQPYLREQVYLNPHPVELMLRNHV